MQTPAMKYNFSAILQRYVLICANGVVGDDNTDDEISPSDNAELRSRVVERIPR